MNPNLYNICRDNRLLDRKDILVLLFIKYYKGCTLEDLKKENFKYLNESIEILKNYNIIYEENNKYYSKYE